MKRYRAILSPTRGGPSSRPNQDRVIEIARENDARLSFLYVTDISFLDRMASPVLVDVAQELDEMGAFVLAMAQERAKAAGVEAEALVRRGDFRSVLQAAIEEQAIDLVVLGSPVEATGATTLDYLQSLAGELNSVCGVATMILQGGQVVFQRVSGSEAPQEPCTSEPS
ncbi:MAG: universal stress protein [Anaerolineales bacterium]